MINYPQFLIWLARTNQRFARNCNQLVTEELATGRYRQISQEHPSAADVSSPDGYSTGIRILSNQHQNTNIQPGGLETIVVVRKPFMNNLDPTWGFRVDDTLDLYIGFGNDLLSALPYLPEAVDAEIKNKRELLKKQIGHIEQRNFVITILDSLEQAMYLSKIMANKQQRISGEVQRTGHFAGRS